MKKTEISPTFVIICLAILIAAYGIGYCIREIRYSNAKAAQNRILTQEIQDIQSYVVNEEPQGQVSAQTRRTRPQTTTISSRPGTFSSGRGQQRGRGMQNLSQQDLASMQEQQRQMRQNFQNMADSQGAQMFGDFGAMGDPAAMMGGFDPAAMMGGGYDQAAMMGGFGAMGDPAAMMGGFDPAAMSAPGIMGGFDPAAMGAPGAMGDPGEINPPEQQIEN